MGSIIAFDLGASSGRAMLGSLNDGKIELTELHRFSNDPVQVGDRLHWDILRLYHEIKQALIIAKNKGIEVDSIGIDSWAVDFGFIGPNGELVGNPYHYRDRQTDGMMEKLFVEIPAAEIFAKTGIQFLQFNTIFQLYALKQAGSSWLQEGNRFLMIPDLLRYFLTGEMHNEFSNATTTQLFNPKTGSWDQDLLAKLGLPASWFGEVLQPGSKAGMLQASVCEELGIPSIPVYAVAEHDTGSAVAAVPASERSFAYLSCGTWSLMGTEVQEPVIHAQAQRLNFTNEGGAYGTYRLLKNIMGLWILQESRRVWDLEGKSYSFPELVEMAGKAAPFQAFIDPDDPLFLPPGHMPDRIVQYCRQTGQQAPETEGEVARCILESLAMKYRYVFEMTEQLSGQAFNGLHMVGGGINNRLLCQWSANAIGKPVWAGPSEGSAIGNLAVQWIAQGKCKDIWAARQAIKDSFSVVEYEPLEQEQWSRAYDHFVKRTGLGAQG